MEPHKKEPISTFHRFLALIIGLIIIAFFISPIILKHEVIGPFDFLVNWYHPYKDLPWEKQPELYARFTKPKNYLMSDVVSVVYPMKFYTIESLKKGVIPLWNPSILNGAPHLANTQSAVLNPFNAIFFVTSYVNGFNIFIVLQLVVAYVGMYLFLRKISCSPLLSLVGGISFMFSGYMTVWLPWGTIGYAYAMLPWALLLIDDHFFFSLVPLVITIFSGHMQTAAIVCAVFYSYVFFKKKKVTNVLLHVFLLFCLSAPQLLPTIQLNSLSARSAVSGEGFYHDQSIPLQQVLNSFAPDYFGNPVTHNWWGKNNYAETVSYAGVLIFGVFLLNGISIVRKLLKRSSVDKKILFFFVLSLSGIVLSVDTPILYLLYRLNIPIFSTSTFSRNLSIFTFGAIVSGCLFIEEQLRAKISRKELLSHMAIIGTFVFFVWTSTLILLKMPAWSEWLPVAKRNLLLPTLLLVINLSLFFALSEFKAKKIRVVIIGLLFVVQTFDMMRFAQKYIPFSPQEFFYPATPLTSFIKNKIPNEKYFNLADGNFAMLHGARAINGSDPLYAQEYAELATASNTGKTNVHDRASVNIPDGPSSYRILDILGTQYIVDKNRYFQNPWEENHPKQIFEDKMPLVFSDGIYTVLRNPNAAAPIYFLDTKHIIVTDTNTSALSVLLSEKFNPKKYVVAIKKELPNQLTKSTATTSALLKSQRKEDNSLNISIKTNNPGILILNQTYFPNWRVTVDGKVQKLLKVNYALQGIMLTPGKHTVDIFYFDLPFYTGVALFFLANGVLVKKKLNKR